MLIVTRRKECTVPDNYFLDQETGPCEHEHIFLGASWHHIAILESNFFLSAVEH
jgi:hypothetical protein